MEIKERQGLLQLKIQNIFLKKTMGAFQDSPLQYKEKLKIKLLTLR